MMFIYWLRVKISKAIFFHLFLRKWREMQIFKDDFLMWKANAHCFFDHLWLMWCSFGKCGTLGIDGLVAMKLTFGTKAVGIIIRIRRVNKVLIVFSWNLSLPLFCLKVSICASFWYKVNLIKKCLTWFCSSLAFQTDELGLDLFFPVYLGKYMIFFSQRYSSCLSTQIIFWLKQIVMCLGAYDDEEAAARAYDLAALKYWGPGTLINFQVRPSSMPRT